MFEVGKEYQCNNGNKLTCIAIVGEFAYMTSGQGYAAYTWHMDGRSHSLSIAGDEYDIKPPVQWVAVDVHYDAGEKVDHLFPYHDYRPGCHNFTLTFPMICGKPDWSQVKVVAA